MKLAGLITENSLVLSIFKTELLSSHCVEKQPAQVRFFFTKNDLHRDAIDPADNIMCV